MKDKLTGDLPKVVGVAKIHEQKHPPLPGAKKMHFRSILHKEFYQKKTSLDFAIFINFPCPMCCCSHCGLPLTKFETGCICMHLFCSTMLSHALPRTCQQNVCKIHCIIALRRFLGVGCPCQRLKRRTILGTSLGFGRD